jgi:AcrR family transcriptional regulator
MTSKSIAKKQDTCCIFDNILALFGTDLKSDKQKAILEASYNLFTEKGYHETTIDDIAHAAKVGKGTIYNYFTDKEAILTFLIDSAMKNSITLANKIDVSKPLKAFERYVSLSFSTMIDIAPLLIQCINMEMIIHNSDNKNKLDTNMKDIEKVLESILVEGKKQGVFSDGLGEDLPIYHAADNIFDIIRQYMISLIINYSDHRQLRHDLDKHAVKLTNFILYGITAKPKEAK